MLQVQGCPVLGGPRHGSQQKEAGHPQMGAATGFNRPRPPSSRMACAPIVVVANPARGAGRGVFNPGAGHSASRATPQPDLPTGRRGHAGPASDGAGTAEPAADPGHPGRGMGPAGRGGRAGDVGVEVLGVGSEGSREAGRSRTMRRAVLLAVLVLLVAGASGAAATEGRAATNKLTGCRNTSTGTLDQVRAGLLPLGGACGAGEVAVTWNRRGPRGPQGETGATGATGSPGVSGWETVSSTSVNDSSNQKTVVVNCPAGKKVVGGGGNASGGYAFLVVSQPVALVASGGWGVMAAESPGTSASWTLTAYAICVTALP